MGMQFHQEKCISLLVTRSQTPFHTSYILKGHTLESVTTAKYMGITISKDMNWDIHINNITSKANKIIGLLGRNLPIQNTETKTLAYKSMVRSNMEYCASVWSPHTENLKCKLEQVQRRSVNYKVIDKVTDENGRIVLLNVQIDDAVFSLVCIYAPNSKTLRNMFFKKVSNFCKEHGTGILVVGGDFNKIMQDIDRRSLRTGNVCKQSVNSLKSFMKTNKLIDVWRIYNENRQQFTWRRKDKRQASRIDMILLGKDVLSLVQSCKIKPAVIQYTDHQSVVLTFRSGVSEKGRGYWKINNSVIQEYDYKQLINKVIDKYLIQYHNNKIDIRLLWDAMKVEIREVTTMYCKNKSKLTRKLRHKLESELEKKYYGKG